MLLTTLVFYVETNNPSGRRTFSSSSYEMSIPEQHKKKKNNQGKKDRKAYQADDDSGNNAYHTVIFASMTSIPSLIHLLPSKPSADAPQLANCLSAKHTSQSSPI